MDSILYLAFRYVIYNRIKSVILVLCVTFSIFLPITGKAVLDKLESELRSRAETTPFVIGARGSQFDLALHSLYFDVESPSVVGYSAYRFARKQKPGLLIPIYRSHVVREGKPVVGTDLSYFDLRGLQFSEGDVFGRIGHCVVGAQVARELGLSVGDKLISKPENDVNLAGATPVRMEIVGVLKPSGTADDNAVFTDIKTTWVIDGLGHGHQDLKSEDDPNLFLDKDKHMATANKGVLPYIEITDENVDTVHFHGDPDEFPLTAIILVPRDDKSATMLQGEIDNQKEILLQMIEPRIIIDQLVTRILKIKSLFDLATVTIILVTVLFLSLNIALSVRLRQREMVTMYKIGCGRFTIIGLYFWEYLIIFLTSILIALGLSFAVVSLLKEWVIQVIR